MMWKSKSSPPLYYLYIEAVSHSRCNLGVSDPCTILQVVTMNLEISWFRLRAKGKKKVKRKTNKERTDKRSVFSLLVLFGFAYTLSLTCAYHTRKRIRWNDGGNAKPVCFCCVPRHRRQEFSYRLLCTCLTQVVQSQIQLFFGQLLQAV